MAQIQLANNAYTTLAIGCTNAATTVTVTASTTFPAVTTASGNWFYACFQDTFANLEIMKVTNVTGTVWTVTRGVGGTTALAFPSGTVVELRVTAETITDILALPGAMLTGGTINNTTIGATTPSTGAFTTLSATGAISSTTEIRAKTGGYVYLNNAADNASTGFHTNASNGLDFLNAGTVQATLDTSGNLGLGATLKAWAAYKAIQVGLGGSFISDSGSLNTGITSNIYYDGSYRFITTNSAAMYITSGSRHQWYVAASGAAGSMVTLNQAMTLDASGNLGVGAPSGGQRIYASVSDTSFSSTVVASICATVAGTGWNHFNGISNGSTVFQVLGNGNVQNTNNSYGAISDVNLKENITDATPKLAGLMQVRIVNYNLKTDPDHKQIGVIAQELEQVFPGLVDETPDLDSEGVDLGTVTKSVKYSVFVPMLVKAIQELKAEFDAYKAAHLTTN